MAKTEIDRLIEGLRPKVKIPRGFQFWSEKMMICWLKQNQKGASKNATV